MWSCFLFFVQWELHARPFHGREVTGVLWVTKSLETQKLSVSSVTSTELQAWDQEEHLGPVFEPGSAPGLRVRSEVQVERVAGPGPWTAMQSRVLQVATAQEGAQSEPGAKLQEHARRWVLAKRAGQAWANNKSSGAAGDLLGRLGESDKEKRLHRGRQTWFARLSAVLALKDP